jgi:AcrR family transcriptional regulator
LINTTVALVDRHGVARFTMRMLAEEIGCSTMATYRHVANKEELIALAADAVLARIAVPDSGSGTTRDRLHTLGQNAFQELTSHAWVGPFLLDTGRPSPHANAVVQALTTIVSEVESDLTRAHYAAGAIRAYLIGWLAGSETDNRLSAQECSPKRKLSPAARAHFDYGLEALLTGILASVS